MNKNIPLGQKQDFEVSETDIDAVIDTNKELFDQLNSIPEIKALEAISIDDEIQEKEEEGNVLISEIIIEGWEDHPEGRKLELAAYDSMSIKPGSVVNNQILNQDLNSIYASGWFSSVKIKSQDGPLGVRLIVNVVPNPILRKVKLKPINFKNIWRYIGL